MNTIRYSAAATLAFLLYAGNVAAAGGALQLAASDQRPDAVAIRVFGCTGHVRGDRSALSGRHKGQVPL